MTAKRFALLSVSDKTGIADLAANLLEAGYSLLSTGGTARLLRETGLEVVEVSEYTGFPEMLDGRVKTLHPKIHGGLLARMDRDSHLEAMTEHGLAPIDVVVVNLYPFVETLAKPGVTREEAVEQIDIGGPSMLRSAAKNHDRVTVMIDPSDYGTLSCYLKEGGIPEEFRERMAAKVFAHTSAYDGAIAGWLGVDRPIGPSTLKQKLRYGENPHQGGEFLRDPRAGPGTLAKARFLGGKELSFNNILDLDAALGLIREFPPEDGAACTIVKHGNPCGTAVAGTLADAVAGALEGDPVSAFGSIVACNREIDPETAEGMAGPGNFIECLIAPSFTEEALSILRSARFGKNLRILELGARVPLPPPRQVRSVSGGILVQDPDTSPEPELSVVTRRSPTKAELRDLRFAWMVAKHVRSNAIVLAKEGRTVGIGAGQMSRVDSVEIAVRKAGERSRGAVLASDAFFPFPDGPLAGAEAGITALIQPGGSRRDREVIEAIDGKGLAMVFTGVRHFRH